METHYIDLDHIHFDVYQMPADDGILAQTDADEIAECGCTYDVLQEEGPAGGNPLIRVRGTQEQLTRYVRDFYAANDSKEAEFFLKDILPLPPVDYQVGRR
jgi:hypothetical protein